MIAVYEEMINKDVYEFTPNEVRDMFSALQVGSEDTAVVLLSTVKKYREWAFTERLVQSNIDPVMTITSSEIRQSVSLIKYKNQYFKKEEDFTNFIDFIENWQDKVIFEFAYEGLNNNEMINLKVTDCDFENNIINVRRMNNDEEIIVPIKMPPAFMDDIWEATKQEDYIQNNGEKYESATKQGEIRLNVPKVNKITPTDYVIRFARRQTNAEIITSATKVNQQVLNQRVTRIAKLYSDKYEEEEGNKERLNPRNIWWSGLFHKLMDREVRDGDLNETNIVDIFEQYGIKYTLNNYYDIKRRYATFKELMD
jgi:hypothetical protein